MSNVKGLTHSMLHFSVVDLNSQHSSSASFPAADFREKALTKLDSKTRTNLAGCVSNRLSAYELTIASL